MPGRFGVSLFILALAMVPARADEGPAYLPRYDLAITFDTLGHRVQFRERVTWTNMSGVPTDRLVFNFSPHYKIPDGDELLLSKTLELLRLPASYGIDPQGRHGTIRRVALVGAGDPDLPFHWKENNQTGLEVLLPTSVSPGGAVTVELVGDVRLPNKQGRWGQWGGISYFTNALPLVAYFDGTWRDVPFVPWHQPFWNEAGRFTATITIPEAERLACSAGVASTEVLGDGWKRLTMKPFTGRDYALVSSPDFHEHHASATLPSGKVVDVKCLALGRHDFYGRELANIAAAAIPVYSKWFGEFPYEQFTIVESFFGWNGNECAGMVMIDERVFDFPTFAHGYVEYLMSHETCHQWWYNLVGTNGYSETFMDEGAATYFTHRMLDARHGRDNRLLNWPAGFDWLPNIKRQDYRNASITGAIRRGDIPPAAQDLPAFGHLYGLFSGAYDRGSRIFGLIESRMGEAAFFDFTRDLVKKYSFKILSAKQLREELVAYSGEQSRPMWDELYERWVYGNGLVDWQVNGVTVDRRSGPRMERPGVRVAVELAQTREYDEPTTVGFQFADGDGYPVRVPVSAGGVNPVPGVSDPLETEVVPLRPGVVLMKVTLPRAPTQVTVDPDRVLMDADPSNNSWKSSINVRVVPFYTFLYDTDLTNDYDRWNATIGPWYYGALYADPWYTRATMIGARAGLYRTQQFAGGAYVAARTDYRDLVFGVDGLWDHWPFPRTQVGFNYERRIAGPWGGTDGQQGVNRAVLYGRYVLRYGSSLYLPPMSYVDTYATYSDNFLPFARTTSEGAVRPDWQFLTGAHYRLNLLTPYWDPERGIWVDATYAGGVGDLGPTVGVHQGRLDLSTTQKLPDGLGYFSSVKVAGRGVVQGALPARGQFFALGGSTLFRGFDLAERQGSLLWAANAEVRLPIVREVRWDVADHLAGVRNVQIAGFYDVGAIYTDGHAVGGGAAHALGLGLRVDLAFFSFIERAVVRLDVGKTINAATPWQVWFGVQQPF